MSRIQVASGGRLTVGEGGKIDVGIDFVAIDYTTWNPSDIGDDTVLSNGDLTAQCGDGTGYSSIRTVEPVTTGQQKVWEVTLDSFALGGDSCVIGLGTTGQPLNDYVGHTNSSIGYLAGGIVLYNNGVVASYASYTTGDVIGIEVDFATSTYYFYKNGVSQGSVTQALSGGNGDKFPMVSNGNATGQATMTANFGASAFVLTPQGGYTGIQAA